mmetsp:Transcript_1546/g.6188  ORF Transcript_1546/g.6188 Transcript_1546/m.6188 type:complete len:204 (-) Transcript_1546:212-823(-)
MPLAHHDTGDLFDVTGQSELQAATRQVPNLDGAICAARDEPLVPRVDGARSHPPLVSRNHTIKLPRRSPLRLRPFARQSLRDIRPSRRVCVSTEDGHRQVGFSVFAPERRQRLRRSSLRPTIALILIVQRVNHRRYIARRLFPLLLLLHSLARVILAVEAFPRPRRIVPRPALAARRALLSASSLVLPRPRAHGRVFIRNLHP